MFKALTQDGIMIHIDDAATGHIYRCPICKQSVFQRRPSSRRHHFVHYGEKEEEGDFNPCKDSWHYDKTEWHYEWQERFGKDNLEVLVEENGVKHFADVLVNNVVIEFQHSNITPEEFHERNEFYKNKKYKIVWIFDLIEEFNNEKIVEDQYQDNKYHWSFVKKLFKSITIDRGECEIYFQFYEDEIIAIKKGYDEFKIFYTDPKRRFGIDEFIDAIKNGKEKVYSAPLDLESKEKSTIMNENKIKGCSTIFELWKREYRSMLVYNMEDNYYMIINGKKGEMYRERNKYRPKIIGKYVNDYFGKFKYGDKYYPVKSAERPIWKLHKPFLDDKDFEHTSESPKAKEKDYSNCIDLFSLINATRDKSLIVYNNFHEEYYYIDIIDDRTKSFNGYLYNINNKTKSHTDCTEKIRLLAPYKIWFLVN